MPKVHSIHAAKTHLSRLVERAEAGEVVVIARGKKPVAKLAHRLGRTEASIRRYERPRSRNAIVLRAIGR